MATKCKITLHDGRTVDGYRVNEFVGLYKHPDRGAWRGHHFPTGWDLNGQQTSWKQKRQCLAFLQHFIDAGIDFSFQSVHEMEFKNPDIKRVFDEAQKIGERAG